MDFETVLGQRWVTVCDAGPPLNKHMVNVSVSLEIVAMFRSFITFTNRFYLMCDKGT